MTEWLFENFLWIIIVAVGGTFVYMTHYDNIRAKECVAAGGDLVISGNCYKLEYIRVPVK